MYYNVFIACGTNNSDWIVYFVENVTCVFSQSVWTEATITNKLQKVFLFQQMFREILLCSITMQKFPGIVHCIV